VKPNLKIKEKLMLLKLSFENSSFSKKRVSKILWEQGIQISPNGTLNILSTARAIIY